MRNIGSLTSVLTTREIPDPDPARVERVTVPVEIVRRPFVCLTTCADHGIVGIRGVDPLLNILAPRCVVLSTPHPYGIAVRVEGSNVFRAVYRPPAVIGGNGAVVGAGLRVSVAYWGVLMQVLIRVWGRSWSQTSAVSLLLRYVPGSLFRGAVGDRLRGLWVHSLAPYIGLLVPVIEDKVVSVDTDVSKCRIHLSWVLHHFLGTVAARARKIWIYPSVPQQGAHPKRGETTYVYRRMAWTRAWLFWRQLFRCPRPRPRACLPLSRR